MDEYHNKIIQGHALDVLKKMPDKLVDCVITSPPYWSLRDYKTEPVVWGGSPECAHAWGEYQGKAEGYTGTRRWKHVGGREGCEDGTFSKEVKTGAFCSACNAWRGQLGLEPTIELYIDHLLQIFDEVGQVMKDEGTLWVNLGDSYCNTGKWGGGNKDDKNVAWGEHRKVDLGIPAKSLCLIPQRFAIAMVDRGWILRNVIVWAKPSCMPSSAKDRFTVDFEYVYFFVKQQKYWFEQQFEPQGENTHSKGTKLHPPIEDAGIGHKDWHKYTPEAYLPQGRNKRCVWTVNTQPYPEAHFATFPEKLVEPMILAGCPEFVCLKCGKGRERILEQGELIAEPGYKPRGANRPDKYVKKITAKGMEKPTPNHHYEYIDKGLTDCGCGAGWKPGITLDPFIGSGTVAIVAAQNRRDYLGIDLSGEYNKMSDRRIFDPKNAQIKLM